MYNSNSKKDGGEDMKSTAKRFLHYMWSSLHFKMYAGNPRATIEKKQQHGIVANKTIKRDKIEY